jgi:hypothetical protein
MTIEATLENINRTLEKIVTLLDRPTGYHQIPVEKPVVVEAPAPIVPPVPQEVIPPTPQVAIPTAGVSLPPAAPVVTANPSCPITDAKSLMDIVMAGYKKNPAQGMKIQDVLNGIGCKAINEVQPQHYAAVYAGLVELGLV